MSIKLVLFLILILGGEIVFSQTKLSQDSSLVVTLNRQSFNGGDTIMFEAASKGFSPTLKVATLHVNIEDMSSGRQWKCRYPFINGFMSASFIVDSFMNSGKYAFNFFIQPAFFSLSGRIKNEYSKKEQPKQLNYLLILKDKKSIVDITPIAGEGSFKLDNLLFQDTALILFSKPSRKLNDLKLEIKTPLDSAFTPLHVVTQFIDLKTNQKNTSLFQRDTLSYRFAFGTYQDKNTLAEVIVKTKSNARTKEYIKENVSAMFSGWDMIEIDGIESDEIAQAPDLLNFLSVKAAGLRVEFDNETGIRFLSWRKKTTDIYLNEIKLDENAPLDINPEDIALIRIFRPGVQLGTSSGEGGAVAIYLKNGDYQKSSNRKYSFYIKGYDAIESILK